MQTQNNPIPAKQFDFGENWREFSENALTPERVSQARLDFHELTEGIVFSDKSFLDIGFGQGLGLMSAAAMGANVTGCDINPKCAQVLESNRGQFPGKQQKKKNHTLRSRCLFF